MSDAEHSREGSVEIWRSRDGTLRMWLAAPSVALSTVVGHFDVALAHGFLTFSSRIIARHVDSFHDWSGTTGYDGETRRLFTSWVAEHRDDLGRIVICTKSRLVRMGIATARLTLGGKVEAVATRRELDEQIAQATCKTH